MAAQLRLPQYDSPVRAAKRSRSSDHSPALSHTSERLEDEDDARLPPFLRQSSQEIEAKFEEINFEQFRRLERARTAQTEVSPWTVNVTKEHRALNRYTDIWPWEETRIRLKVPHGQVNYINASSILLSCSAGQTHRKYIATQGPKQNNVDHFWQMVWQETESPAVVVMLTQLTESMREKCFKYFPDDPESDPLPLNFTHEDDEKYEGSVHVSNLVVDEDCKTMVREITLTYNGTEKKIWHLFFQAWPDFGVPQNTDRNALFSLIRMSREKNQGWTNPRIVHCSAGVGRSGTFIALEHLIDELDQGHFDQLSSPDQDPIFDTVNKLREQRMTMVQSDAQYAFLYESLADAFRKRLREKDGRSTLIPHRHSSDKLSHGEPSPKAIRLSRSLRNILSDFRSRSSSRKRDNPVESNGETRETTSSSSLPQGFPAMRADERNVFHPLILASICTIILALLMGWYLFPYGDTLIPYIRSP